MYICIDLLVLSYYFYPMVKMKEGFKGERFASLPDNLLETYSKDPLIGDLFLRKIGYFPRVKYHYIQKEHGCDYTMLIYCTDGEGWYEIYGEKHILRKNEYIILPQNTPYAFGANNENPWTIYWLHFKGKNCKYYQPGSCVPRSITPDNHSRLQDRLLLFEEIYHCFSLAHCKTYHFLLFAKNKKLTKIVSLTGNDLETSGLLYSAMFCINQKNASLICKSSVFLPHCQNYSSEK